MREASALKFMTTHGVHVTTDNSAGDHLIIHFGSSKSV